MRTFWILLMLAAVALGQTPIPPPAGKAPTEADKAKACQYGQPGCPPRPQGPIGPVPGSTAPPPPPYLAPQMPPMAGKTTTPPAAWGKPPIPPKPQVLTAPVWVSQPKLPCDKFQAMLKSGPAFRCGTNNLIEVQECTDRSNQMIYTSKHEFMCMPLPPKMPHDARNPDLSYPYGLAKKPPK